MKHAGNHCGCDQHGTSLQRVRDNDRPLFWLMLDPLRGTGPPNAGACASRLGALGGKNGGKNGNAPS
jgi:hypothetical protein